MNSTILPRTNHRNDGNYNNVLFSKQINRTFYLMYFIYVLIFLIFYGFFISSHSTPNLSYINPRILNDNITETPNQPLDALSNTTRRPAIKEERYDIFSIFLYESYKGTWSSNVSLPNFKKLKGTVQLIPKINQNTKSYHGLFYNYDFFFFDGEYNHHSIRFTNQYYFAIDDSLPSLSIDSDNRTAYISNNQISTINELRYLTITKTNSVPGILNMSYEREFSHNRTMNGTIEFNEISLQINMTKNNIDFFYDILFISITLINLGIAQLYILKELHKKLEASDSENLKYSPLSIMINCILNNGIGIQCFLATLYDAKLFRYFILPTVIYIINSLIIEVFIFKKVIEVHIQHDHPNAFTGLMAFRKYISIFFMAFVLYFMLLTSVYDLFFWKSLNYAFTVSTFIYQIAYNFKSYHLKIISKRYIGITSVNRLIPILFFRLKPNFLYYQPDYIFSGIIIGIIALEITILIIQRFYRIDYLYRKIYQRNEHKYYNSLREIQKNHNNIEISTCPVCFRGFIRGKDGNTITSIVLTQPPNNNTLNLNHDNKKENHNEQKKDEDIKDVIALEIENDMSKSDKNKEKVKLSTHEEQLNNNNQDKKTENIKKKRCCIFSCCSKSEKDCMDEIVMITPCLHIFHIECLQDWMKIKANCPVCRSDLPLIR